MASPASHFIRTVCLKDWWLTEAENNSGGSRFAVAGFESGGVQAARVFSSASILRRYDLFTLKTTDGIFVLLKGPINKERTCESGFSTEVFKHFLIGFPSNWEESAQKCFARVVGPDATSYADINSELNAGTKTGNVTLTQRQSFWEDPGSTERPETFRDEPEEEDVQLLLNIHSAKGGNTYDHVAASGCDKDTSTNTSCHNSDAARTKEGVRYNLRNRKVPRNGVIAAQNGKQIKDIASGKSILKNTISADMSMQDTRDENGNKTPTPDGTGSRKPNAQRRLAHEDATLTGENGNDAPQDAGELKKSNSDHCYRGESDQAKKSKKSQIHEKLMTTAQIQQADDHCYSANVHVCTATPETPNSTRSCAVEADDNSTQNQNGKANKNMRQTPGHLSLTRLKVQKQVCKDDTLLQVFSFQDADKLEAAGSHRFCARKSHESKKEKNQRSTSKLKSNPKTGVSRRERNDSLGSTPKQAKRKLDYAEQKTPTSAGKRKGPDELSQSTVPKTSRSGRLLLPTMEFWRNQLPIYDADHGISGIKDGTSILKFQRGQKSGGGS